MRLAAEEWKQRLNARTIDADTAIAEALLEMKKPDEAIKQLEPHRAMILEDVRTQPQAAVMLARAMLARNDGEAARAMLKPLLADAVGRRMWLTLALGAAPDLSDAVAWVEDVVSATPTENLVEERWSIASAWTNLARKYNDRKLLENAAEQLNAYLGTHPRDGEALFLQAGVNLELGRMSASETGFRAVLSAKPDHAEAANDLACLLTRQNRNLDEAEKLARLAVQKQPKNANFHDSLARVLLARKQLDAAQAAFELALRLDPDHVEAHVGLARTYNERGNQDRARRELQQVETRLRRNGSVAPATQEELASLRAALGPATP
jgi:tetratricopeptide (TPR) repeat protein